MKKIVMTLLVALMFACQAYASELHDNADMLFDWAEEHLPQYFYPGGQQSQTMGEWFYRCYSDTENCVGINAAGDVHVIGRDFPSLMNIGPIAGIMEQLGIVQQVNPGENGGEGEPATGGPSCTVDMNMFKTCMDGTGVNHEEMEQLCRGGWSDEACPANPDLRCQMTMQNGEPYTEYYYISDRYKQVVPNYMDMLRDTCRTYGGTPQD